MVMVMVNQSLVLQYYLHVHVAVVDVNAATSPVDGSESHVAHAQCRL